MSSSQTEYHPADPEQLALVVSRTTNSVVITDRDGCIEWVNPAFEKLTGYSLNEVAGRKPGDFLQGPDTNPETVSDIRQKLQANLSFERDILNYHRDGTPFWMRLTCNPIKSEGAWGGGYFAIQTDITRFKEYERSLKVSASVFERSQDAIMITDKDNRLLAVNPAFTRITGYEPEEVIGSNPSILSSGLQSSEYYQAMWHSLLEHNQWRGEIWNRRKSGEVYPEFLSITRVHLDEPATWYHVATFSDITILKNHAEELDRAAHYDELTGLPNRQLMMARLRRAMDQANETGTSLAVCYLDLDGFKAINSQLGQELGDRVLREIANRLLLTLNSGDTVARVGGDEFVLLLRSSGDNRMYRRILNAVRQPLSAGSAGASITASMGITIYPEDASDEERLVRHADHAMYSAKGKGRNNFHFFDPVLDELLQERRTQLTSLTRALQQEEFELHFQPQVRMSDQQVVGFEALVRWRHPEQGLIPPARFLPFIEGSHLEESFGLWVLKEALEHQASWAQAGYTLGVSINISPTHLLTPAFVSVLQQNLDQHPELAPSLVTLEIVESAALDDMHQAGLIIQECRQLGVQVALDDFGTGFSSLSYFRSLPVDLIKIDQSFIRDMLEDDSDLAIVESVIYMARRFSRTVLAEGVETPEHFQMLNELNCDLAQGYGIARPMPASEVPEWLARRMPGKKQLLRSIDRK